MKPFAVDDFCNFKFLSGVKFSPSGSSACFAVSSADKKENRYLTSLYVRKDGDIRRLTSNGKDSGYFCFDGDDAVIFRSGRDSGSEPSVETRFYRISLLGGEAEPLFTLPIPASQLFPLRDGRFLVLGTTFPGFEELYTGSKKLTEAYLRHIKENEDYEELTQLPWWWNGGGFSRGAYSSLFCYDPAKNALTRLTDTGLSISDVRLSTDERAVYYCGVDVSVPMPEHFGGSSLYRLELASGETQRLVSSREGFRLHTYELGDSFILLTAADEKYGMNTDPDFYKMAYGTWEITPYAVYGLALGSSVGSDVRYGGGDVTKMVGDTYYFVSTRFDSAGLYRLENGEISPVIEREGSIDCFDISGDRILMSALWDMRPQELYDEKCRRVSSFNVGAIRGKYTARPETLNITADGHEVHGFVLKPMDYDPAKKYPVILDVHGGPKTVYGAVFYHEMQHWAGKGYFVIYCNPTGSDGRGEFMDIRGKYGTVDYDDIMAFCDAALEAYPAMDSENFFETGGSYGGFMTNWIITHTDRFRACASQRSISNWISFYGVSDIGPSFSEDQCAAKPWPSPEKLWEHSPLKYAENCKTPTLFIHAFEDYRCPIDQGYQMYSALMTHGVESRMVCFRGENHELSRSGKPLHRIKRLSEITSWFDSHRA